MGKKFQVQNDYGDTLDVELDDDIAEDELDCHPDPSNALSDDEIYQIETEEGADHR